MKLTSFTFTTALASLALAGIAHAGADEMAAPGDAMVMAPAASGSFGYIGATVSYGSAFNPSDSPSQNDAVSYGIDGAYAFVLNGGAAIVADATVQISGYDISAVDNEVSQPQYQASVHYLHPLNNGLILNAFAGYGMAPFEDSDEKYQVGFVGGGVYYQTSQALAVFGQAGYGTSFDEAAMSSAGFYNGYFVRAGVEYSGLAKTILRGEAEYASTEVYEDSAEPGEMWTVGLSGETAIGSAGNIVATYGVRYGFYDALNDPDEVGETTISLGAKYMFGGGSSQRFADIGYVGTPYLPLRASFWTPEMD